MGRVVGWRPEVISDLVAQAMPARVQEAAETLRDAIRVETPVGETTRRVYSTGKYAGAFWTAREGGALRRSVRATQSTQERPRRGNSGTLIWRMGDWRVYIGHKKAYYAAIVEYRTPFIRPTLARTRNLLKMILGAR